MSRQWYIATCYYDVSHAFCTISILTRVNVYPLVKANDPSGPLVKE